MPDLSKDTENKSIPDTDKPSRPYRCPHAWSHVEPLSLRRHQVCLIHPQPNRLFRRPDGDDGKARMTKSPRVDHLKSLALSRGLHPVGVPVSLALLAVTMLGGVAWVAVH